MTSKDLRSFFERMSMQTSVSITDKSHLSIFSLRLLFSFDENGSLVADV